MLAQALWHNSQMKHTYKLRRAIITAIILVIITYFVAESPDMQQVQQPTPQASSKDAVGDAATALSQIPVKGRAAKTGYTRTQFGDGWQRQGVCDMRNIILNRDLTDVVVDQACKVQSGTLNDPYTATTIHFKRGGDSSSLVQIDHVVALSDAWQKGAQQLTVEQRRALANDPLELLAVDGAANQTKSDSDAATWLPDNKAFRCQYVARQIAVKQKYSLWVTAAERDAMTSVLQTCPGQPLPVE